MENKIKQIFILIFLFIICFLGLTTLDNREKTSVAEARNLSLFPELAYEKIINKDYLKNISEAFNDQLEYREKIVKIYYKFQNSILHTKYIGSTVIGKENYLFIEPKQYEEEEKKKEIINIAKIINKKAKSVSENGCKFIFISYPRKDVALQLYLPKWYPDTNKKYKKEVKILKENLSDDVILIDALEIFEKNKSNSYEYFYKTDHHVNYRGQQLIYNDIMNIVKNDYNDITIRTENDYTFEDKVIDGSDNRKVGRIFEEKEELNVTPKYQFKYERWESGMKSNIEIFGTGNTYASAFMGNDYAQTTIITENKQMPNILISGTSFTNALESLLCSSFYKTTAVDYRHNKSDKDIVEYVKERNSKYLIFIPANENDSFSLESVKQQLGIKQ